MTGRKWTQAEKEAVLWRREQGETLEAIGHHYGVTKERIRQLQAKLEREAHAINQRENIADPLDLEVQYLDVPIRVLNCLCFEGIKTVRELLPLKESYLLSRQYFGRKSFYQLKAALAELGVKWPVEVKP